jgi:F5/8 type C domain-containing protein
VRAYLPILLVLEVFLPGQAFAASGEESVPCTVQADSTLAHPRFAPFRLFDGNTTDPESRWASSRSPEPHWIAISFPKPISIDRIVVHAHKEPDLVLRACVVQVQEDGVWRTLAAVSKNSQTPVEFSFTQCQPQSVRLWITDACRRDSTARLFEIELFAGDERIPLAVHQSDSLMQPRIDDDALLESVRPLPNSLFVKPDEEDRNGQLLAAYRQAIARWGDVLAERIVPVPERTAEAFYGRGGNREDDVRPIGYAVMVNAILWRIDGEDRTRNDASAALRYLTASHVTGPSTCLNGKKWGDAWQSAMWARAAGVGAWALWDELDRDLRLATARMIEHEADRFLDRAPKSSVNRDTGAEENAWNALILSLATNMMPRHPRAEAWGHSAKRYLYNVFSVPADAQDTSPGDNGLAVNTWVTTTNAHADFTVENHGLVHMGYQKTSIAQLLENAVHYLAVGSPPPLACRHHVSDATELLYQCAGWDGAPVYFGGNDWKIVHTQPTDLPIYAVLSILANDQQAALQEERGLDRVTSLQAAEDGFFNVRRDLEYGGLCASRLAACYLAHAARGPGADPLPPEKFDQQMTGVSHLEEGRAILHRTPDKFASFAFGPKWMALTLPCGSDRTVWPHYASYLGLIDGEAPTEEQAVKIRLSPPTHDDGFWVVGRLNRCGSKLLHDFAFISPTADVTIYVERLHYQHGFRPDTRETGIIGHEYDISSNHRTLFGRFGSLQVQGTGGETKTHKLATDWLNVGNRIGYVIKRFPETQNVVRYHDLTKGTGRVPKLQEWFSLIGNASESGADEQWACIVTYPNRSAEETDRLVDAAKLQADANTAAVSLHREAVPESTTFRVDFGASRVDIE